MVESLRVEGRLRELKVKGLNGGEKCVRSNPLLTFLEKTNNQTYTDKKNVN